MARGQSPLVGYNTNVRHKGKLYHIQTEDSGVQRPHIITHLFADGGRIVASRKTDYAQHVSAENVAEIVKKLMQEQHKAMFIALRDCEYDEDAPVAEPAKSAPTPAMLALPEVDLDALERAAEAHLAESAAAKAGPVARRRPSGRYKESVPASIRPQPPRSSQAPRPSRASGDTAPTRPVASARPHASIFTGQVLRGKTLDDVILSYLSDDNGDDP